MIEWKDLWKEDICDKILLHARVEALQTVTHPKLQIALVPKVSFLTQVLDDEMKEAGLCLLKFIGPVPLRFWPIG